MEGAGCASLEVGGVSCNNTGRAVASSKVRRLREVQRATKQAGIDSTRLQVLYGDTREGSAEHK